MRAAPRCNAFCRPDRKLLRDLDFRDGKAATNMIGFLALFFPLSKRFITNTFYGPQCMLATIAKPSYARVPNWPAVSSLDSFIAGINSQDHRDVVAQPVEAWMHRFDCQAAVII